MPDKEMASTHEVSLDKDMVVHVEREMYIGPVNEMPVEREMHG